MVSYKVERVGVIGAGAMGTGIAEVTALAGLPCVLVKATGGDVAGLRDRIERSLRQRVDRGKLSADAMEQALDQLQVTSDRDAVADTDLVIESIVEDLGEKRRLFVDLAARTGEGTVLASNTSTLRITELAGDGYDTRTIGLHFFSPVPAMSLVELAHLAQTDPAYIAGASQFVAALGKTAVPVLDSTGFVVNRLLVPYLIGAIWAYEQGLAAADQIDTAMKLGCNHPVGPLMLCDLIGLDVVFAMAKLLHKDFGDSRYQPPALLRRLVQDGDLGKKTGRGFYDHSQRPPVPCEAVWSLTTHAA